MTTSPTLSTGDYYGNIYGSSGISISTGSFGSTISVDLKDNLDIQQLQQRLSKIEERLCILIPDVEMQQKYPALQEAYDAYQLILKMVNDRKA